MKQTDVKKRFFKNGVLKKQAVIICCAQKLRRAVFNRYSGIYYTEPNINGGYNKP